MSLVGCCRAHIVVNFAAWTAGACIAHGPEIFFQVWNWNDAVGPRSSRDPKSDGFFIAGQNFFRGHFRAAKHGEIQAVHGNTEPIGGCDEFPGVSNGIFLEVVAKRKISQHLEERVMAVGEHHVFKIVVFPPGTNALLR